MEKMQKRAPELAQLIRSRMTVPAMVRVHADPAYGWHPVVFATPSLAYSGQLQAEEIARELRGQFYLVD